MSGSRKDLKPFDPSAFGATERVDADWNDEFIEHLTELAIDRRYSNEFIGNVVRVHLARLPASTRSHPRHFGWRTNQ